MSKQFDTNEENWKSFYEEMTPFVRETLKLLEEQNVHYSSSVNDVLERAQKKREEPVYQYLENLDIEQIKFIQTVMYIGRGYNEEENKAPQTIYKEQKEELDISGWNTKDIEINQMLGKAPLADYLMAGLSKLRSN